jgi:NADP-dependent 3-hydroxy acid dehydrogenase YdfG
MAAVSASGKILAGKTAWVTGAASGIGEATALALSRAGATVALTGRRLEPLEQLAARIASEGGEAIVAPADVADVAAIERALAFLAGRSLDIVVSNAGTNIPDRSWSKLTPDSVDLLLDANLRGALQLSRAVLPVMQAQGGGVLIHIGSLAAHVLSAGPGPVYTAAKSGVVAMSHAINIEHGVHGIRSCVLSPGDTLTPLMDKRPVKMSDEVRARMLRPEDIAGLVLHVATLPPHVCVNEIIVTPTSLV